MQRGQKPRYEPPEITLEREQFIWETRISQRAKGAKIALLFEERFGETVSQAHISRVLKKYREESKLKIEELVTQERTEQNELMDWAISQAALGWQKSLASKTTTKNHREIMVPGTEGNEDAEDKDSDEKAKRRKFQPTEPYVKTTNEIQIEELIGDPRFLRILVDASQRKAKLFGLDAAPKSPKNDEGDNPDPTGARPWEALAAVLQQSKEIIAAAKAGLADSGDEDAET